MVDRNVEIGFEWGIGDADWIGSAAARLVGWSPDIIIANGAAAIPLVQKAASTIPIIFIGATDPVAQGFVQSLAHPGGNTTGFTVLVPDQGAKLLALLKELVPRLKRVRVLVNPDNSGSQILADSAQSGGRTLALEVSVVAVRGIAEIERAIAITQNEPDWGLLVPPDPSINTHRKVIVELAASHRLPAIYALRSAAIEGGLISYGVDLPELFREAAGYANRILRGEAPGGLPVQQSTKFELVVNLKTAKALGLSVPQNLLALADEVIE
jgi:putative tryptophan/tyrosine transport system substrate-binding protein